MIRGRRATQLVPADVTREVLVERRQIAVGPVLVEEVELQQVAIDADVEHGWPLAAEDGVDGETADAGASGPRQFLAEAARAIKRMALDRMAMALSVMHLQGRELTVSSAGMPPLLVYRRASSKVED